MKRIPSPRNMFPATLWATVTWTITVNGRKSPRTDMYGIQTLCRRTGLPIATATGATLDLGVGRGLTIRLGDLLRSTMAAGTTLAAVGAGALDRSMAERSLGRHSSDSLVGSMVDSDLDLESGLVSAGSR